MKLKNFSLKKTIILHPFLFGLYPALFLFNHNRQQLSYSDLLLPTLIIILLTGSLFFVLSGVLNNRTKAAVIISLLVILFFSHGLVVEFFGASIGLNKLRVLLKPRYTLTSWSFVFVLGSAYVIKTSRELLSLNKLLNIIAGILIAMPLLSLTAFELGLTGNSSEAPSSEAQTSDRNFAITLKETPDIYYIVLDAYGSSKTLQDVYNFDNSKIIRYLENKGFYIPSKSSSNYKSTYVSLASTLNMKYLNYLEKELGAQSKDVSILYKMIQQNEVIRFLKPLGYNYVHFSSGWGPTHYNKSADVNFQGIFLNEFSVILLRNSMLGPFEFTKPFMRERILFTFNKLQNLPMVDGPKFVFAHVMLPHPPWIFGADGEQLSGADLAYEGDTWKQKERYIDHVKFTNKNIMGLVEEILSKSNTQPIIIIQGDHGPFSTDLDEGSPAYKERFGIFNAYYFPGGMEENIYESITPVNTFRVLFNSYFDKEYEILEDRNYFTPIGRTYSYTDVTREVMEQ